MAHTLRPSDARMVGELSAHVLVETAEATHRPEVLEGIAAILTIRATQLRLEAKDEPRVR